MNNADEKYLQKWREALWDAYVRLECERVGESPFFGEVTEAVQRSHCLTIAASTAQRTTRSANSIRTDPKEFVLCALQVAGEGFVEQADRQAHTKVGDLVLYETTKPYTLMFTGPFKQVVLKLPRHLLDQRMSDLSSLTGRPISGAQGVGALVRDFIERLVAHGKDISEPDLEALMSVAADLVATASHSQFGDLPSEAASFGRLRNRLCRMARDPSPDLAAVARAEHMSLRTLQRIFHANGTTPSRIILQARLEGVMRDLKGVPHMRVGAVAASWGFNDLSYFSKAFRARFGVAPSDVARTDR